MELLRYMLTNVARRPLRALFIAAAGLLSSVVLVFAFALGSRVTEHVRADTIAKWTGQLWISLPDGFEFKEDQLGRYRAETRAVRERLASLGEGGLAVPWRTAYTEMQVGTEREGVEIQAADFGADAPYKAATELVAGAFPGPSDEYGIVITTELAEKYGLKVGDSVTVFTPTAFGSANAMDFGVVGIAYASAPWYDNTITLRASDFIALTETGDIYPAYKIYLKDESRIPALVSELSALAPDFKVKGYMDDAFVRFLLSLGASDIAILGAMAMIVFLALLIGINSIVMTNIFDRRDEIGTLRALGFSKNAVRNVFFGESLVALVAGYALGAVLVAAIGAWFDATVVRPPLLLLQYMFGMTRMGLNMTPGAVLVPFAVLIALLGLACYRRIGIEAEKRAVVQMANR